MEVMPPPSPPRDFVIDSSAGTGAAYSPESAVTNPFASANDTAAGNPFLATAVTAPPSPNPFEHLPPPGGASDANPFDLFQHFTSAPASPARAAAIYAEFVDDSGDDDGNADGGFQPRVSYSTVTSTVPFEWEEKPGKPKPEFATLTAATTADDADFDFGVLLDKAAQTTQELTTADELFDEGKIRPLKPPPRLLDAGSLGSSPRSARSMIWSPRLRGTRGSSTVGPGGADFDPFAAALEKAARAPSPLGVGGRHDAGGVNESASSPTNRTGSATSPTTSTPPANKNNGGWKKKWRLSDLLLFRRASAAKGRAAGNVSRDPVFKYAPVQQQLGTPVDQDAKNAEFVAANGDASSAKHKKQSVMGCVRLHPGLHRLAKGFKG